MHISKFIFLLLIFTFEHIFSTTLYSYNQSIRIYGEKKVIEATYEDTLVDLARIYNIGLNEIISANPKVNKWLPGLGTLITIPSEHILPKNLVNEGIIINLSEFRGYFIKGDELITFPVGIGKMDWRTPLGLSEIDLRLENPAWYPPISVREEYRLDGKVLDPIVPPGPNNPLGKLAMRMSIPGGYFIHGTNRPDGVGMEISHGCIRLFPEDIEKIFKISSIGTKVLVVDEPIKIAKNENKVFLQIHDSKYKSYLNEEYSYLKDMILNYFNKNNIDLSLINWIKVKEIFEKKSGIIGEITN